MAGQNLDNHFSINQLSTLTGMDRATIAKRLMPLVHMEGTKGAKLYSAVEALPLIYKTSSSESVEAQILKAELDYKRNQARIKGKQAELIEKKVAYIDDVIKSVGEEYEVIRAALLNLPHKLAKALSMETDPAEIHKLIETEVKGTLTTLATDQKFQNGDYDIRVEDTSDEDETIDSEAPTDPKPG